mgnify:CR=1 FL=1
MASRQFYGDLDGYPRFFDPRLCETHTVVSDDGSEIVYARVGPGIWVRGVWKGMIDHEVPKDGPKLARRLLDWDQVRLIEVARIFRPHLPPSLVRDIEPVDAFERRSPETKLVPVVKLNGPDEPPIVWGRPKRPLTPKRYDTLKVVLDAGLGGIGLEAIRRESRNVNASRTLKSIKAIDNDWDRSIEMAGQSYNRYKITHVPAAQLSELVRSNDNHD